MKNTKSILPVEVIDYLESYYETYNTLPTKVLECNAGTGAYTAFGTNLAAKVAKAGGIRTLITTFTGRGAKKSQKIEAKLQARPKKTHKVTVTDTVADVTTEIEALA